MILALREYHRYYGSTLTVEMPAVQAENHMTLDQVADEYSRRLVRIFLRDPDGRRPVLGDVPLFQSGSSLEGSHPVL